MFRASWPPLYLPPPLALALSLTYTYIYITLTFVPMSTTSL